MRNKGLCLTLLALMLAGCATNTPVPADPPPPPVEESEVYRPGYTVLAHDRPGLVGKIAAAPGHVLTTNANQDYNQVQEQLDEKERRDRALEEAREKARIAREKSRQQIAAVTIPKRFDEKSAAPEPKPALDLRGRAWKRYCDNGNGLTDADHEILKKENYVIPKEFEKNCRPPK